MQNIEEIYNKYFQTVYKYMLCLTNANTTLSEDLTAETFVIAMEKVKDFKGTCKMSVWLCQIAKFLFYKEVKKNKHLKFEDIDSIKDEENIEENLIEKEDRLKIFKDIQKLDENTRSVMYLRVMGNLSFDEIAEVIGKSANWARVTYFRGKEKLKEVNKYEK